MDWRRLERWAIIATIAAYAAAVVSLAVFLGEILLPESSPAQRTFHGIANYLGRLGDIGGGSIVAVIMLALVGGGTYVLILRAIDKINENRERRARERAEWEAASRAYGRSEGRSEGHAQGRAQGRAEIIEQLKARGVDVDELIPPDEPEANGRGWLFP